MNKPILIEGPPGVGKTSLVENLAKVSGKKLIRVNLSEQTDMMDLLGSEYPVSSKDNNNTEEGKNDDEGEEEKSAQRAKVGAKSGSRRVYPSDLPPLVPTDSGAFI